MEAIVNEIISTVIQILFSLLVPLTFFYFRSDKSISFLRYVGFYKPSPKSVKYALAASLIFLGGSVSFTFLDEGIRTIMLSPPSVTGKLKTLESRSVVICLILLIGIFKTSLSEELFFRGFLAKRLISALGFNLGNGLQSIIFGVIHLLLFWKLTGAGLFQLGFILVFSTTAGWIIGLIKERYANGSMIPGWIAHGIGNTLAYFIIVFIPLGPHFPK